MRGGRKVERDIEYYNLEMIISVGYRVKSQRGIEFRRLANAEPENVLAQSRLHDSKSPFLIGGYKKDDKIHDVPQKS